MTRWTTGKRSKETGDLIMVERILGLPYLHGDYKAVNPRGAMRRIGFRSFGDIA